MVAHDALLRVCARSKMLSGLTGPETMERLVHHVLLEGRHAAHTARLRDRLARAHEQIEALLDAHGFEICARPRAGLFLWARPAGRRAGLGADALARMAADAGIWLTPGSLFDIGGRTCPGCALTWRTRRIRSCGASCARRGGGRDVAPASPVSRP